ncbi:hypothetical protein NCAS_0C05170 [Naumovozyma castellii]|uniref:UBX domain-containing protein n=1 Tax=Naumovozyma castellii TaxID=27288 RepID=G0VDE5_NAUCA|nr:hypothetical protein NCAS_0C05170 [Naumovozyma castellii CBS 4309]CCC69507.1 hypothetical protein NCAS_0C05170 [Naumovozyma castellii CBS 4309]
MPSIAVHYNFSTFRVKTTPNSNLQDALRQSLAHFHLEDTPNKKWILVHNKKKIALDLPGRFLNLPNGANLDLIPEELSKNKEELGKLLKIRFQIVGRGAVIANVRSNGKMVDILAQLNLGVSLKGCTLKFFSKSLQYEQLDDSTTLESLGIDDQSSIKIILAEQQKQEETKESTSGEEEKEDVDVEYQEDENGQTKTSPAEQDTTIDTISADVQMHMITTYKPTEVSLATQLEEEEEVEFEMTIDQARRYQNILSKQTGNLNGPLLTKRLREKSEKEHSLKRTPPKVCTLRIRFPDRTHIEATFNADDTMVSVYNLVSNALLQDDIEFTLNQSYPYTALNRDESKLVNDLKFGKKNLLVFSTDKQLDQYLKDEFLSKAKDLSEADDVKLDRETAMNNARKQGTHKEEQPSTPGSSKNKTSFKKVPKWLKLSKK